MVIFHSKLHDLQPPATGPTILPATWPITNSQIIWFRCQANFKFIDRKPQKFSKLRKSRNNIYIQV